MSIYVYIAPSCEADMERHTRVRRFARFYNSNGVKRRNQEICQQERTIWVFLQLSRLLSA